MIVAANGRPCIEMGSRRTQELAAVAAARAAYVAGFEATSNLEAGRRYGVPTRGTSAHSFTLLHGSERDAFAAQIAALGRGHHAAGGHLRRADRDPDRGRTDRRPARGGPPGLRRPGLVAEQARELLDSLGASADQDRRHLRSGRVRHRRPRRGPGRQLRRRHVAGDRQRPPDLGFRLQARGAGRRRRPGRARWSRWRRRAPTRSASVAASTPSAGSTTHGVAEAEIIGIGRPSTPDHNDRELLGSAGRGEARSWARNRCRRRAERHVRALAELPDEARRMSAGEPVIETVYVDAAGEPRRIRTRASGPNGAHEQHRPTTLGPTADIPPQTGRTFLVTGANSGLGLAASLALVTPAPG